MTNVRKLKAKNIFLGEKSAIFIFIKIRTNLINLDILLGPTEAPKNFRVKNILSGTEGVLEWDEVSPESIRGHFRGYKIHIWTLDDVDNVKEILVKSNSSSHHVLKLTPDAMNVAKIMAFNDRFVGPPSNQIEFQTPEGVPSTVQSLQAFPLGSSAFMLQWKRPVHTNGKLRGYRVYYSEVNGTELKERQERVPMIQDPDAKQAKLAGLKANTKYRIAIQGFTSEGLGEE